jgi:hypothetical protein
MKQFIYGTLFLALVGIGLIGCKKDGVEMEKGGINSFKNVEELNTAINKTLSMSNKELEDYETLKGFKSFGRKCEDIYWNLNIENLTSFQQIESYVSNNHEFIQLIKDDNGELTLETVLHDSPYRYIINVEKMFILDNKVIKVFAKTSISTNIENINDLRQLNENTLISDVLDEKFEIFSETTKQDNFSLKDAANNCGNDKKIARKDNGNNRTLISIDFHKQVQNDWHYLSIDWNVRPYHKVLGVWYWCNRTLSWNFKVRGDYYFNNQWSSGNLFTYGTTPSPVSSVGSINTIAITNSNVSNYHFGGYNCWGTSPSTDNAELKCNIHLF